MNELYEGLVTYCASRYNTQVGTTVLTAGVNFVAGVMPDMPDDCVAIAPSDAARDPNSKIRKPEFNLVVRSHRDHSGRAVEWTDGLFDILSNAVNVVPHHPGFVRAVSEPGAFGLDDKKRTIMVTKFAIRAVSL